MLPHVTAMVHVRRYNVVPEQGSEEAKLCQVLKEPREWAL